MHSSLRNAVFMLVPACLVVGCAGLGSGPKGPGVSGARAGSDRPDAPELSRQRRILSEGYSLLYADASKLDLADLILYVKAESDALDELVTEVAESAGVLKKDLERLARDYPGVRIDLDPLPEMEKRKRAAISEDRARDFAPIVGRGGREYERTVLIGLSNAFNHERHLCEVMAEEEPDPGLKKFLLAAEKRYERLYDRAIALLEREHFRNPGGESNR